ncbi:hypothetical protein BDV93DRAFT_547260 [Ceratobasidium sp. AG-I]|nr:hypothetical protein BDV93DRAFT_547260 [Ceratobasidium sp. AG-I]
MYEVMPKGSMVEEEEETGRREHRESLNGYIIEGCGLRFMEVALAAHKNVQYSAMQGDNSMVPSFCWTKTCPKLEHKDLSSEVFGFTSESPKRLAEAASSCRRNSMNILHHGTLESAARSIKRKFRVRLSWREAESPNTSRTYAGRLGAAAEHYGAVRSVSSMLEHRTAASMVAPRIPKAKTFDRPPLTQSDCLSLCRLYNRIAAINSFLDGIVRSFDNLSPPQRSNSRAKRCKLLVSSTGKTAFTSLTLVLGVVALDLALIRSLEILSAAELAPLWFNRGAHSYVGLVALSSKGRWISWVEAIAGTCRTEGSN